MFPRFSIVRQQTLHDEVTMTAYTSPTTSTLQAIAPSITTSILLKMSLANLTLDMKISSIAKKEDTSGLFNDELYPHQRLRNTLAIIVMLLIHVGVIYTFLHQKNPPVVQQGQTEGQLVFLDTKPAQVVQAEESKPKSTPTPVKLQPQKTSRRSAPARPSAITQAVTRSATVPVSIPSDSPVAAPVDDTSSRIAAARERRHALEASAAEENHAAAQASHEPSENELAMANINRNLQAALHPRKGTNGIFRITSKGARMGQFTFRGWTNDPSQSTHETFDVDAGLGGDVDRAIIRKMIQLIRKHYSGNFNWESSRLGKVVELSARPEDNAGLEEFMMHEFFGN